MEEHVCCICGERFLGYGNNPWPVVKEVDARCCDTCNGSIVLGARIAQMFGNKEENDEH